MSVEWGRGAISARVGVLGELSRVGICLLVMLNAGLGYLVGQPLDLRISWIRLAATLLSLGLMAAGSSAINQAQEAKLDARMARTRSRPIPSGRIKVRSTYLIGAAWLVAGLALAWRIDPALAIFGVLAAILYNGFYTHWWKKRWPFAAVPGAIPGALPVLMGHLAASGRPWAPGGIYLFALVFFWQMPHFWVLALRYRDDYREGGFPVLPVAHGSELTIQQIGIWSFAYLAVAVLAPLFLPVGPLYLVIAVPLAARICVELIRFAKDPASERWVSFFLWTTFSVALFLVAIVADSRLPKIWPR